MLFRSQHLCMANLYGKSDYMVLDIEFEVSRLSSYRYLGPSGKVAPRFDLIAIDRAGNLCVIELKTGTGALYGKSGMREHYICYQDSIHRNPKPFVEEMRFLLNQKKFLGIVPNEVEIKSDLPRFLFAFTCDGKKLFSDQEKEFKNETVRIDSQIQTIVVPKGTYRLMKNSEHSDFLE